MPFPVFGIFALFVLDASFHDVLAPGAQQQKQALVGGVCGEDVTRRSPELRELREAVALSASNAGVRVTPRPGRTARSLHGPIAANLLGPRRLGGAFAAHPDRFKAGSLLRVYESEFRK